MTTIVTDFDGTLVPIPSDVGQDIGKHLNYIDKEEPMNRTLQVIDWFDAEHIYIVTGRTEPKPIRAWLNKNCPELRIERIYCAPNGIHGHKHSMLRLRQWKAVVCNKIAPDVVIDDDLEQLKMYECSYKILVHKGALEEVIV